MVPDMLLALAGGGSGMVDPARRVDCPKAPPEDVLLRDCSISSPAPPNNGLIGSPGLTRDGFLTSSRAEREHSRLLYRAMRILEVRPWCLACDPSRVPPPGQPANSWSHENR